MFAFILKSEIRDVCHTNIVHNYLTLQYAVLAPDGMVLATGLAYLHVGQGTAKEAEKLVAAVCKYR